MTSKPLPSGVERGQEAIPCSCGGYCDRVSQTEEEIAQYGCGRWGGCCAVAFVCRICKTRYAGHEPAPDME